LYNLDTADWTVKQTISLKAKTFLTVRLMQDRQTGEFNWNEPTQEYTCMKLLDKNLGGSKTGYIQYLYEAGSFDKDCQEVVELTRKDGKDTKVQLTVNVAKGFCKATTCKEGLLQNLDVESCKCEPVKAPIGELFDARDLKSFNLYFKNGVEFTLREWANSDGKFEWTLPVDHSWAQCLKPVTEKYMEKVKDDKGVETEVEKTRDTFTDQWGRFRQVYYKADVANCKDTLVRV
jgi:hypothetical protein